MVVRSMKIDDGHRDKLPLGFTLCPIYIRRKSEKFLFGI